MNAKTKTLKIKKKSLFVFSKNPNRTIISDISDPTTSTITTSTVTGMFVPVRSNRS